MFSVENHSWSVVERDLWFHGKNVCWIFWLNFCCAVWSNVTWWQKIHQAKLLLVVRWEVNWVCTHTHTELLEWKKSFWIGFVVADSVWVEEAVWKTKYPYCCCCCCYGFCFRETERERQRQRERGVLECKKTFWLGFEVVYSVWVEVQQSGKSCTHLLTLLLLLPVQFL